MSFDEIARANKIALYKNIIVEESKNKQKLEEARLTRVREASARAMNELHHKLDEEVNRHNEIYGENIALLNNPAEVKGGFVDASNLGEYKKFLRNVKLKIRKRKYNTHMKHHRFNNHQRLLVSQHQAPPLKAQE